MANLPPETGGTDDGSKDWHLNKTSGNNHGQAHNPAQVVSDPESPVQQAFPGRDETPPPPWTQYDESWDVPDYDDPQARRRRLFSLFGDPDAIQSLDNIIRGRPAIAVVAALTDGESSYLFGAGPVAVSRPDEPGDEVRTIEDAVGTLRSQEKGRESWEAAMDVLRAYFRDMRRAQLIDGKRRRVVR